MQMRVAQISFFTDAQSRTPDRLLEDWWALPQVACAAAAAGARITVIQSSTVTGYRNLDGVDFHFVAPEPRSGRLTDSPPFQALLRSLAPDMMHVHGLSFPDEVAALQNLAPQVAILLQDHADRVPQIWHRRNWRRAYEEIAGVAFCARGQADPFIRAGILRPAVPVFEIPEASTSFTPGDRERARRESGMHGDPALLWVGHLNSNKDPMTVIDGLAGLVRDRPELTLSCCYGTAPLLTAVEKRLSRNPPLRARVRLLGFQSRKQIQDLMRAADIFVLGSHREGCCFSLIEALATGLTPVVTDIPSSRALTGDGEVGVLWRPGDSRSFEAALRKMISSLSPGSRSAVRRHFEDRLSHAALGERLVCAYEDSLARHRQSLRQWSFR